MNEEMIALARRAVACKGWRWMPGARALSTARGRLQAIRVCDDIREWVARDNEFPDLTDPATLGCLLALVREVWGKPNGQMRFDGVCGSDQRGWYYYWTANDGSVGGGMHWYSPTEAQALVAALEAAP
jgi:hypothetical protein